MQIGQQLCSIQGHDGCKITHICIFSDCEIIYNNICDKCLNEMTHNHPNPSKINFHISVEKFQEYIKDQKLPQIEFRLLSQKGNQVKLKYITKIYEEDFDDLELLHNKEKCILEKIKYVIQNLVNDYKAEMKQAQSVNEINQQLTVNGLGSLKNEQLNILLDNHLKFISKENEYYREINNLLNNINIRYNKMKKEEYKKLSKIVSKLRRINQYLDFQQYSIHGEKFQFYEQEILNTSFFSKNDRYFAMFDNRNDLSLLKIRKQNNLGITQQLFINKSAENIQFDSLFNYCGILDQSNTLKFYVLRKNKQFKLIQKLNFEQSVDGFYLSKLNNLIVIFESNIAIMKFYSKNVYINEIQLNGVFSTFRKRFSQLGQPGFCYGNERCILAVGDESFLRLYNENQNKPFIISMAEKEFIGDMMFINNDEQLLTAKIVKIKLWQIDHQNFTITLIKQMEIEDQIPDYFLNKIEFNIILLNSLNHENFTEIQIFDVNFNLWFSFKIDCYIQFSCKFLQLTKHFLILSYPNGEGIQVIKRRSMKEYERLDDY